MNQAPKAKAAQAVKKVQSDLNQLINLTKKMTVKAPTPRKRKRARKGKNTAPQLVPAFQNLNQVQKTLTRKPRSARQGPSFDAYMMCRVNPFLHSGGAGIPDGGNSKFVVIDNVIANNIVSVTAAPIVLQTFPTIPVSMGLIVNASGNVTVDGVPVGPNTVTSAPGATYFPMGIPTPYLGSGTGALPSLGQGGNDPYSSASARIVSIAHRIIYTGTALTCSGVMTVTPNPVSFTDASTTIGEFQITNINAAGTSAAAPAANENIDCVNADFSGAYAQMVPLFTKDSVVHRQEMGAFIRLKHRTNDFKMLPTRDTPYGVLNNLPPSLFGTVPNMFTAVTQPSSQGFGILAYDNDWDAYSIVLSGHQAGATFRVETAYCVEYSLNNASAFTPLSKKASILNLPSVARANRVIDALPASVPGNM